MDPNETEPRVLPYYRLLCDEAAKVLMDYYMHHKRPEPYLYALLTKADPTVKNPYLRDGAFIHRWIQQWMPRTHWGNKKKVEGWINAR